MNCPQCQAEILDIDVKCASCGAALGATGAHRMIGQTFLNTYELVDVLGQGGMSVVFKAKHKMTDQEVALKILPPELAAHSQVKSRFLEEAKALAALDHPNIVHLYNFGQENGSFVLAMQYVQGKTWERAILERKRLDWKISCRIAIDVLKALEYAHGRGVVHRDMKPSNVLVRESDGAATVMDFGIAKMAQSTRLTATGQTMGTVRYMSPEQVRGQEVDLRTDIYSLGATLYESLVGDTPFDGSTHFEIMTKHLSELPKRVSAHGVEVPKEVDDAIIKSLAKKATDRFENARDMRKILEQALKDGDVALFETQRLNREILGDVKAASKDEKKEIALAPTGRAATANDLANELEGSTASSLVTKPARSKWPMIALALLVLGGGGATAAMFYLKQNKPAGYTPHTPLQGVTLTAGKQFDSLYIESTKAVAPDEVFTAYASAIVELEQFDKDFKAERHVVQDIVAIPQDKLCSFAGQTGFTYASTAPCKPSDQFATVYYGKRRQLLISDDTKALTGNVRAGIGQAVCDFAIGFIDAAMSEGEAAKLNNAMCDFAKRFRAK